MSKVIRWFALFVAIAGLAAASTSSSKMHTVPSHLSATVSGAKSMALPGPLPCQSNGSCAY
jgi:hypothetical protein